MKYELIQGDCIETLSKIESGSIDLVITDPAYESLEKHRSKGTTTRLSHSKSSSNDWFKIFPNARFQALFAELFRVLKKDTHFYMFCDQETAFIVKSIGEDAGFTFWKPLVWDKKKIGMGYHYRARYEFILFFEKGKRRLNDLGMPDILECDRVSNGYPTEKPVELIRKLVHQSSSTNDVVLDCFNGSGATGDAALSMNRHYVGIDISEASIQLSLGRLSPYERTTVTKSRLDFFR